MSKITSEEISRSIALQIIERSTDPHHIERECEQLSTVVDRVGGMTTWTFEDGSEIRTGNGTAELLPTEWVRS
jgi:hypothetical protein